MMQPRCAVCDGDNDVMTLCDFHHCLCVIKHNVDVGMISDWPPLATDKTDKYPRIIRHADMLLRPAVAPLHWQTMLAVALTSKGALLARTPEESGGDWLAVNGLLDFGEAGDGKGRAA